MLFRWQTLFKNPVTRWAKKEIEAAEFKHAFLVMAVMGVIPGAWYFIIPVITSYAVFKRKEIIQNLKSRVRKIDNFLKGSQQERILIHQKRASADYLFGERLGKHFGHITLSGLMKALFGFCILLTVPMPFSLMMLYALYKQNPNPALRIFKASSPQSNSQDHGNTTTNIKTNLDLMLLTIKIRTYLATNGFTPTEYNLSSSSTNTNSNSKDCRIIEFDDEQQPMHIQFCNEKDKQEALELLASYDEIINNNYKIGSASRLYTALWPIVNKIWHYTLGFFETASSPIKAFMLVLGLILFKTLFPTFGLLPLLDLAFIISAISLAIVGAAFMLKDFKWVLMHPFQTFVNKIGLLLGAIYGNQLAHALIYGRISGSIGPSMGAVQVSSVAQSVFSLFFPSFESHASNHFIFNDSFGGVLANRFSTGIGNFLGSIFFSYDVRTFGSFQGLMGPTSFQLLLFMAIGAYVGYKLSKWIHKEYTNIELDLESWMNESKNNNINNNKINYYAVQFIKSLQNFKWGFAFVASTTYFLYLTDASIFQSMAMSAGSINGGIFLTAGLLFMPSFLSANCYRLYLFCAEQEKALLEAEKDTEINNRKILEAQERLNALHGTYNSILNYSRSTNYTPLNNHIANISDPDISSNSVLPDTQLNQPPLSPPKPAV